MAANGPDPREFLELAQRMLRQFFDEPRRDDEPRRSDEPWADATRQAVRRHPEPSPEEQRQNLTFALATRAVEALEDLALNVASIRQRLERTAAEPQDRPAPRDGADGQ